MIRTRNMQEFVLAISANLTGLADLAIIADQDGALTFRMPFAGSVRAVLFAADSGATAGSVSLSLENGTTQLTEAQTVGNADAVGTKYEFESNEVVVPEGAEVHIQQTGTGLTGTTTVGGYIVCKSSENREDAII